MASASCSPAKQPLPGRPQAPYLSPHPQALPPPVVTTLGGLSPAPALSLGLSFPLGTWKDGPGSSQGYFQDSTFHGFLPSPSPSRHALTAPSWLNLALTFQMGSQFRRVPAHLAHSGGLRHFCCINDQIKSECMHEVD